MKLKRLLLTGALLPAMACITRATDATYVNNGIVTFPPNIDAITFINNGTFSVTTPYVYPFRTQNTLNFTNNYLMQGNVGFDFARYQGNFRTPAANFFNRAPQPNGAGGRVEALDALPDFPSRLLVLSSNVENRGYLTAGGAGFVQVVGTNVELAYSTVEVTPLAGNGGAPDEGSGSVIPDVGVFDRYWGVGNNSSRLFQSSVANGASPTHSVTNYPATRANVSINGGGGYAWAKTNILDVNSITITNMDGSTTNLTVPSNSVVDAVFVGPASSVFSADARFQPSTQPSNDFNAIGVVLSCPITNPVTRAVDPLIIGIRDEVASRPSQTLSLNSYTNPPSYQPTRLDVTRAVPTVYAGGAPGNVVPFDPNVIWGTSYYDWGYTTFTNARIDNWAYSAYEAHLDNLVNEHYPGVSVTNLPGRVEIKAGTLDLDHARIRGEGLVSITGRHVISTTNLVVNAQNVALDLGSTNATVPLVLQDVVAPSVLRLHGDVATWAGVWTNTQTIVITNNYSMETTTSTNSSGTNTNSTSSTTNYVQTPVTNVAQVQFHVLIVSPFLTTVTPVSTEKLALRATNVVDNANTAVRTFFTDARNFTLNGALQFGQVSILNEPAALDLRGSDAPNLVNFTNNGTLFVINESHFGDDRASPYETFVNTGTLDVGSLAVRTASFENPGRLLIFGSGVINAQSSKLQDGSIQSQNDVTLMGNDLKLYNFNLSAGTLYLDLTNALFDNGAGSSNVFDVGTGFNLLQKPTTGDLLGTHITTAAAYGLVPHVWAGEDRGATASGFHDNAAVGWLTLNGGFGKLTFKGAGPKNGLYVDYLEVIGYGLTNLQDLLSVDPSLTIYFAAANLPEEQLDGQLGGRLRWVSAFAGPRSSVAVLMPNGQTIQVNKALRQSLTIDSDGDGLPNGVDPSPFDGVHISHLSITNQPPPQSVRVTWDALANTTYRLEYKTNLAEPAWQLLTTYTNNAATNGPATVMDTTVPVGETQRYYRVRYGP